VNEVSVRDAIKEMTFSVTASERDLRLNIVSNILASQKLLNDSAEVMEMASKMASLQVTATQCCCFLQLSLLILVSPIFFKWSHAADLLIHVPVYEPNYISLKYTTDKNIPPLNMVQ
jgi:hypothetical protein